MIYRKCFQHLGAMERRRVPPTPADHLRLHRLERPEQWGAALLDEIWSTQPPPNLYYDLEPLYEQLSHHEGVPKENIVLGAGIEGLIRNLVILSCDPGDGFAFTHSCAMFPLYAQAFGAKPIEIIADPDNLNFFLSGVLNSIALHKPRLVLLPNPGQPVETCLDHDAMGFVAKACADRDAVLAIDEAYYGFGAPTCLRLVEEFDNVIILRTFSKAFGAAAFRVGYGIGQQRVIKPLHAIRESGEISGPSVHAASVLLRRWKSHVIPGIAEIVEGRDWLRTALTLAGFKATGHLANKVLIDLGTKEQANFYAASLLGRGVHVRTNTGAAERFLMVTAGTKPQMSRFFDEFTRIP